MTHHSGIASHLRLRRWPRWAVVCAGSIVLAATLAAGAALRPEPPQTPEVPYETYAYNGNFTFARIRFEPTRWGFGNYTWAST